MTVLANETHRGSTWTMPLLLRPIRYVHQRATIRRQDLPGADHSPDVFLIRRAQLRDLTAIIGLIDEAAEWLGRVKFTDQWQKPWPDEEARDQRIYRGIKSGRTWMVEDGSDPASDSRRLVGTVSCGRGGNKLLWTQRERNQAAAYISRLIVSRGYAGQGIGAALLNWAGLWSLRTWQAQWIRLDVWTTNTELQDYYRGQHFTHLRTVQFADSWDYPSAALFQKPTNEIVSAEAGRFLEVS